MEHIMVNLQKMNLHKWLYNGGQVSEDLSRFKVCSW